MKIINLPELITPGIISMRNDMEYEYEKVAQVLSLIFFHFQNKDEEFIVELFQSFSKKDWLMTLVYRDKNSGEREIMEDSRL